MLGFLRVTNAVMAVVNICLFVFWLSLTRIDVLSASKMGATYIFDHLSFQIAVLQTVMAFGGVVLAVIGFFGFQFLRERAELVADKIARETTSEYLKTIRGVAQVSGLPAVQPDRQEVPLPATDGGVKERAI
jgi:hypothetical protein